MCPSTVTAYVLMGGSPWGTKGKAVIVVAKDAEERGLGGRTAIDGKVGGGLTGCVGFPIL
jgi:hypothetical protein